MSWFSRTLSSSLGKKYLMAVTGLFLGLFLLVHSAGNSTIFFGRKLFLSYAEHLHSLGFLIPIAELCMLATFLVHVSTGIILYFQNLKARDSRYCVQNNAGGRTLGSRSMIYTGVIVLCFVVLHLMNFHFTGDKRPIADIVGDTLSSPLYFALYGIGIAALAIHLSHGFWSLFQSFGLNHPKYDCFIKKSAWGACGVISAIFGAILVLLVINSTYLH